MVRLRRRRPLGFRSTWLAVGALGVVSGAPRVAYADPPRGGPTTLLVHRDPASDAIVLARTRMAKGDCVGALEAFDAALRTSVDVTVHRDRGLCHEKLGQPFPAMDDFRVYLTAVPDAPDSEDIRTRLNQLEIANGFGGTGTGGTTAGSSGKPVDQEDPFAVEDEERERRCDGRLRRQSTCE
jgi:hypothetical protein